MNSPSSQSLARTPQPAQQSTALAVFNRSAREQADVTALLQKAQTVAHLVSPATACGQLPDGIAIAFSTVLVDVARDTYAIGGDGGEGGAGGARGLGKTALDKIAAAAGVSWDPQQSRRLDDGRCPAYCEYMAVGHYRALDGSPVTIQGTKAVDLRDGSPTVEALFERYKAKLARWERDGKRGYAPKDPTGQIREMKLHVLSLCESKARLRAIRALGIRTSYTVPELAKPFVVARSMFTGQTQDPDLRRELALMNARAMLFGRQALYGDPAPAPALLPRAPAPPAEVDVEHDDDGVVLDPEETATTYRAASPPASPAAPPGEVADVEYEEPPSTVEPPVDAQPERSGFSIPGGRAKGTPIESAADQDLEFWTKAIATNLANGTAKPQFRARDEAIVAAMRAELARRGRDR